MRAPTSENKVRLAIAQSFAEESLRLLIIPTGLFAILALFIFISPTRGKHPRDFSGKIVDKRVSVFESEKGSTFVNDLVIEEGNGKRFRLSVTDEFYGRAIVGMRIKRSEDRLDLFTESEWRDRGP